MHGVRVHARPPHLIQRRDTWFLRVRVPLDLLDRLGMTEVRRSLRIGRLSDARLVAPIFVARVKEAFAMIRTTELSRAQANELIRSCFKDMDSPTAFNFRPRSNDPWFEILEQRHYSNEYKNYLQRRLRRPGRPSRTC